MGEPAWASRQKQRVIEAKQYWGLYNLIATQQRLSGFYYQTVVASNREAQMTQAARDAANKAAEDRYEAVLRQSYEDTELMEKVVPSNKAMELNAKADALASKLESRFPLNGTMPTITINDLKSIDAEIKKIRDELKKLSQWTPEQVKAAIDALPPEDPHR